MSVVPINVFAILAGGVVNMVIGFLWYSPALFGKAWMKLSGISMKDMEGAKKEMPKLYGTSFVLSLVTAFVLQHASVFAGAYLGTTGVALGLMTGFFNWLGFVMPVQATNWLFAKQPFKLFVLHTGYQLAALLAMGVVLSVWS